jgi:hypothetical protein
MGRGFLGGGAGGVACARGQRDGYYKTPKCSTSCPSVQGHAKRTLLLRLPGRALEASADEQPHRVELRDRRLRQRVTKGAGSRAKALTMAFKLLMLAQERWRSSRVPLCYR